MGDMPASWPKEVRKATEIVNARSVGGEFTILDRKLFNILLSHAYHHLQTRPTHRISLNQLALVFFDTGRSTRIKESLERLWNQKIAIDYVEDEATHSLRCHYLSFDLCQIEDGHVTYAFDPLLIRFLRNPKVYSQIQLNTVHKLTSTHALKLYEQMRMFYTRYVPVWNVTLPEAHAFFEVSGVYLKRFDSLRQRVIDPAVAQINEYAEFDVAVDYRTAGQGGKIVGMTFTAIPKSAKRIISAADATASHPRRRKDGNTIDLFAGVSDNEHRSRPVLRADVIEQARRIAGPDADIDEHLEAWSREFGASGALSLQANEAFLAWLGLRVAGTGDDLAGIDVDAFFASMVGS